ncbi:MAG: response regulator transcription factor [Leptotrichiaceae bacterium]|nr:response regulator transcription factor [Leptotrichiaceae bacterium]
MRILVVEDEINLNDVITEKLKESYYGVDSCFDGEEALEYISYVEYDAVILDVMLPKLDGFEVLRKIRAKNIKTPILLLTARDSIEDRVKGLDYGANDYLVKPFAFDELLARIRVMLRDVTGNVNNVFAIADLIMDCDTRKVTRNGNVINLSAREFTLLEYMIRNQGRVLTREKIEEHIWNYEYEGGTNVIDVYIRYLRKKIDEAYTPKLLHTVRGVGYVLRVENE